jgi:hypothetical protein
MEHLVRVQNERDRRTLEWLRERLSDEAITAAALNCGGASKPFLSAVCRSLGVIPPRFTPQRRPTPSVAAERSLATIRAILSSKATSSTLKMPRGTVNLLADMRPNTQYVRIANLSGKALQHRSARHAFPRLEGLGA